MFSRLAKFSFDVFSFLVYLPFHLLNLAIMAAASVVCGVVAGFIMSVVMFHCGFSPSAGWAWAFVVTPSVFATGVYRRYVRGDWSDQ